MADKLLLEAINNGNLTDANRYLEMGGKVTPEMLRESILKDNYEMLNLLLSYNSEIAKDNLVELAKRLERNNLLPLLIEEKETKDEIDEKGKNKGDELLDAINSQNFDLAKKLIDKETVDYKLGSPLVIAINNSIDNIANMLVCSGANVNYDLVNYNPSTPFGLAIVKGKTELVSIMLAYGADLNKQIKFWDCEITPLSLASRCGKNEIVELLLDNKADPNIDNKYPIKSAIRLELYEVCDTLIKYGADIDQSNISDAIFYKHYNIANLLVNKGCSLEYTQELYVSIRDCFKDFDIFGMFHIPKNFDEYVLETIKKDDVEFMQYLLNYIDDIHKENDKFMLHALNNKSDKVKDLLIRHVVYK